MTACALLALALPAAATPAVVLPPLERLEKNVAAYAHEHPDDAQAQYLLGRLHYFGYVTLRVGARPEIVANRYSLEDVQSLPKLSVDSPDAVELRRVDLKEALRSLHEAIRLDAGDPQTRLTLAAVFEYAATDAALGDTLPPEDPAKERRLFPATRRRFEALLEALHPESGAADEKALRGLRDESCFGARVLQKMSEVSAQAYIELAPQRTRCWNDRAQDEYWETLQLAAQAHASAPSAILQKASAGYERLAKQRGEEPDERLRWVQANRAWLTSPAPPEPMSAIVVATEGPASLDDLTTRHAVSFDADGDGQRGWTWLRPEAGLLAWNPDGQGVSGAWRILGSAWYFMHWPNVWRALDALDANRDGVLSGDELRGLGVWVDRHSDAKCEPGEVVPLDQLGIVEISVKPAAGVKLRDGRVLPTYEWTPQLTDNF